MENYGKLRDLLVYAEENSLQVHLSVHGVSDADALDLLQAGTLDRIKPGAATNPPTGEVEGVAQASVFLTDRHAS